MKRFLFLFSVLLLTVSLASAQKKILFDATKAETANNADWVIDADQWNLGYSGGKAYIGGSEANAQRYPTPDQANITSSTSEDYWTGAISAWGVELVQAGYHVETLPYDGKITYGDDSNPQDLKNYDMYVVCEPNFPFTASEKKAILDFVYNGGTLFMISDHNQSDRDGDGWDSPHIWNDLMDNNPVKTNPFGITYDYEKFSEASSKVINDPNNPILHGPYGDVTEIEYYGGTSMTLDPSANPNVKALIYRATVSQTTGNTKVMVAYSRYGKGLVFAFGDSSPFDDGTGDTHDRLYNGWYKDADGNHRILIMNASVYALERIATGITDLHEDSFFRITTRDRQLQVQSLDPQVFTLRVYSLSGRLVFQKNLKGEYTMNLPEGVYIVRLTNREHSQSKEIVIF